MIQSKWSNGNEIKDTGDIGQLVIDENSITFHIEGYGEPFARNFVGSDGGHYYKVYTYGEVSKDLTGVFYHVTKAFLYNGENYKDFIGENIVGITSFSFEIPELADWLKLHSVELLRDKDGSMIIYEKKLSPIIIKEANPKVYIKYEKKLPFLNGNDKIEMTLRNAPRIFIEYEDEVDDSVVRGDLYKIMRFFALLIGRISYADDIRLTLANSSLKMWFFINTDFSYNTTSTAYHLRNRTDAEKIFGNLQYYFEKWYFFSQNDNFSFLQDVFFRLNGKKSTNIEELFLNYCKFLEGYDLRVSEDEEKANVLKDKLNEVLKTTEIKTLMSPIFKEVGSSYKPKDIGKWISTGFLGRVGLQDRIRRLDEKYLQIIKNNSSDIINTDDSNEFYSKITNTRNYYSHFKPDNSGILSYGEMYRTLELLEALIISILFSEMGMSIEVIKGIMIADDKYWPLLYHHRKYDEMKI
ncbi:HEPN domain-containing protein [Paenibacillus pini]|nr:HEPN domain-containing protein [Paenibacillus pini]